MHRSSARSKDRHAEEGLKKGTYKVKVKPTAAASKNYKAAKAKTITLKVTVK